jgi:hypothetical protein
LYDEPLPVDETEVVEDETLPIAVEEPVPEQPVAAQVTQSTTASTGDMDVDVVPPVTEDVSTGGALEESGSVQTVDSSVDA